MTHKKTFLLLTLGIMSGCSNVQQEELNTQSDKINAQATELSTQSDKIIAQATELSAQSDKITAQAAELNTKHDVINTQKEELNSLKAQLNSADKLSEYMVQKGDSILEISNDNNISMNMIMNLNPWLKNQGIDLIYPNDVIKLK